MLKKRVLQVSMATNASMFTSMGDRALLDAAPHLVIEEHLATAALLRALMEIDAGVHQRVGRDRRRRPAAWHEWPRGVPATRTKHLQAGEELPDDLRRHEGLRHVAGQL